MTAEQKFELRCWARALLWQLDELDFHDAIDALEEVRVELNLDADTAQFVMVRAFAAVLDDEMRDLPPRSV